MSLVAELQQKVEYQKMFILDARKQNDLLKAENDRLRTSNERMREFAARLVEYVDPVSHQDSCGLECPAHARCRGKSTCAFPDWALERAMELGVEVE